MPEIAGIPIDAADISPAEKDLIFHQELILTETTLKNLRKILYPLIEGQNLLLVGDAGVGKNALIYYINRMRSLPTVRFSFNQDTLPEDLVGAFRVLPDGFRWNNGPLVESLVKGYTFVADEMNLASPEILKRFLSVFDRRRLALLEKDGSEIVAHERFSFVATQNPARGFEGRKNLPESIARHFTTIYLDHYPAEEEKQILRGLYPEEYGAVADTIVLLQRTLEAAIWKNELAKDDLEHYHFNLRTAQRAMNRAVIAGITDIESPAFRDLFFMMFVNVFRLETDRECALKLAAQVMEYDASALKRDHEIFTASAAEANYLAATGGDSRGQRLYFPITRSRARLLEQMEASLTANDNLLLEGDDAARILELCHAYAEHHGRPVTEIFLSRGMHTSDIVGALRPHGHSVRWVDGPLTAALRRGDLIILENIDAAGSELIEKLNMLLDHAGRLALPPEAEGDSILRKEGECRVIAIKRTRRSRNQQTISRALRNRFFNLHVPVIETQQEMQEVIAAALEYEFGEDNSPLRQTLVQKLALFHTKADEAAKEKKIGGNLAETIRYREEHMLRLIAHASRFSAAKDALETMRRGVDIYYAGMLSSNDDRVQIRRLFDRIFADLPWEDVFASLDEGKKKSPEQKGARP
jgi:midasin (ATPase involved in ribosome maturation)